MFMSVIQEKSYSLLEYFMQDLKEISHVYGLQRWVAIK